VTSRLTPRPADSGFTLIETLIVISLVAIIVPCIALAFAVIVRTSPDTDVRIDDARSTRGLATWLSHDTTSAPRFEPMNAQGGIDTSPGTNTCAASGTNILHLQWTEDGFDERTFVSSYRFVVEDGQGRVVRYTCSKTGGGSFSTGEPVNLTSGLDAATPPTIVLQPVGRNAGDPVVSVDMILTASSGEQVLVETGSRNPSDFFP
jgi:prepilin-type N-terminal cleavage/methylation domain-containing protein